jgi:hypothetical protein
MELSNKSGDTLLLWIQVAKTTDINAISKISEVKIG